MTLRPPTIPILWLIAIAVVAAATWLSPPGGSPVDVALHDTYYVRAQWDHVVGLGVAFLIFAGLYAGFRRILGVGYNARLAALHFGLTFIGVLLLYVAPQLLAARPARYLDYAQGFGQLNRLALAGSILSLAGFLAFLAVIAEGLVRRFRRARKT